jgi:signal peptidase II
LPPPSPRFATRPISLAPFGLAIGVLVLFADQLSKWWVLVRLNLPGLVDVPVLPGLDFTMVWNHGVTFGLLQAGSGQGHLLLGLLALAITLLLVRWMHRTPSRLVAACLGLIVGGAIGNIVDRLRYGAVVDFIRVHAGLWSWYVFNVADSCIVCGIGVLLLDGLRARPALQRGS